MNKLSIYNLFTFSLLLLIVLLVGQGCSAPKRLEAVPPNLQDKANIPGMPDVRYWADEDASDFLRDGVEAFYREQAFLAKSGHKGALPVAEFLAISGGGDDGAFGAGLLIGWTAAGNRPEFKAVTGISTGALIAPFAFLGPAYDPQLKEVYTNVSPKDILKRRSILSAIFKDSMADNAPLFQLMKKHINQEMLAAIAAEHEKGRLLLIATTDLDAQRAVIWNMGKIAASGHPNALELFQRILLASAAIPAVFPPTLIEVEANGKTFQEMHVDGGAMAQVFMYPPSLGVKMRALQKTKGLSRERRLYIIRNARLDPNWAQTERRTMSIAGRAISSLIQTQGIGDLYMIYLTAERDGVDYNLAYIPETFKALHKEDFDTEYMRQLFDVGYKLAVNGYPWAKTPPGFVETEKEQIIKIDNPN
ncbi:MAG: patatin-like phospholipase family protein [Thermodesulfobacteriota bacterium]